MRDAAASALLAAPTTAKDDDAAVRGCGVDLESNAGLALMWRLSYKRVLQQTYKAADARVSEAEAAAAGAAASGWMGELRVSAPLPRLSSRTRRQ